MFDRSRRDLPQFQLIALRLSTLFRRLKVHRLPLFASIRMLVMEMEVEHL